MTKNWLTQSYCLDFFSFWFVDERKPRQSQILPNHVYRRCLCSRFVIEDFNSRWESDEDKTKSERHQMSTKDGNIDLFMTQLLMTIRFYAKISQERADSLCNEFEMPMGLSSFDARRDAKSCDFVPGQLDFDERGSRHFSLKICGHEWDLYFCLAKRAVKAAREHRFDKAACRAQLSRSELKIKRREVWAMKTIALLQMRCGSS